METGILPQINTGIAHKDPGVGMVGAGILRAPGEVLSRDGLAKMLCECIFSLLRATVPLSSRIN